MKPALMAFAAVALVPAMSEGALAATEGAHAIVLPLCAGGSLVINADGSPAVPTRGSTPCCAKGCRSTERKRRIDAGQ